MHKHLLGPKSPWTIVIWTIVLWIIVLWAIVLWTNVSLDERPLENCSHTLLQAGGVVLGTKHRVCGLARQPHCYTSTQVPSTQVHISSEFAHTRHLWYHLPLLHRCWYCCRLQSWCVYLYVSVLLEPIEEHCHVLGIILNNEHCYREISCCVSSPGVQKT